MFGVPVDLIIRHYKTDWWGERLGVWRDAEPYPDAEPLMPQLRLLLEAEYAGRVTIVNPFGAVLSQNKLSLAFMWEEQQPSRHWHNAGSRGIFQRHTVSHVCPRLNCWRTVRTGC